MNSGEKTPNALPQPLDAEGRDLIFGAAHTFNAFRNEPVSDETLRAIYDLMKWGPTSFNGSPGRIVFVKSKEAKELLAPALLAGNLAKTMAAPVTAIIAYDLRFAEALPRLFPALPTAQSFYTNEAFAKETAFRNGTLQGAYFIIAARALGLSCGPMSGFDNAKVDAAFFPDGRYKSNFLVNLGYGAPEGFHPRSPRLTFDEVCSIR